MNEPTKPSRYQRMQIAKALQVIGRLNVELRDLPSIADDYASELAWRLKTAADTAKTIHRMVKAG